MSFSLIDQFKNVFNLESIPFQKKEFFLREFIQSKIIEKIYQTKIAKKIFFVGGTSLRLLYGLDRFSLDLDFDYQDLEVKEIENLYDFVVESLEKENIEIIKYKNLDKKPIEFEIRLPKILYNLNLRPNPKENLVIKLDFDDFWTGHKNEVLVFDKFGFLAKVVTVPKNEILTQKLFTFLNRKKTQARDIYDIVWLLSQGVRIDWEFAKRNKISSDLILKIRDKIIKEKNKFSLFKKQIASLLVNHSLVDKIDFFVDYFPSLDEIKFERFETRESIDFDGYLLIFYFRGARKTVKFVYKISGTAMANSNFILPRGENDTENIKKAVDKIIFMFYKANPFKDYHTKIISTINLNQVFDFENILE